MPSDIDEFLFFGYVSNPFFPFVELINSCQNSRIKTSERKDESHVGRDCHLRDRITWIDKISANELNRGID
jgi:hypothetical protein